MSLLLFYSSEPVAAPAVTGRLQARAGIARAANGASGYFLQTVRVTVGGADVTARKADLVVRDDGRSQTATFSLRSLTPPTLGATVSISVGSVSNVVFAGTLVSREMAAMNEAQTPIWTCECQGWAWLLNLLKPIGSYTGTAGSILADILSQWAPNFTYVIEDGLPSVGTVNCDGSEGVGAVLDRITGAIPDGLWAISPGKVIRIYTAGQEVDPVPAALTNSNTHLKAVLQARTALDRTSNYIIVRGGSARLLADVTALSGCWPVDTAAPFSITPGGRLLADQQWRAYSSALQGGTTTTLTGSVAVGATTIPVAETAGFGQALVGGGWARIGNSSTVVRFTGRSTTAGAGNLTGVPASGAGSVLAAASSGEVVTDLPVLDQVAAVALPGRSESQGTITIPEGTTVTAAFPALDATEATNLAAAIGATNGYVVTIIDGPAESPTAAAAYAAETLARLKSHDGLQSIVGRSTDPSINPRRTLTVSLADPVTITATVLVSDITITDWDGLYRPPVRQFSADQAPPPDGLDYILSGYVR